MQKIEQPEARRIRGASGQQGGDPGSCNHNRAEKNGEATIESSSGQKPIFVFLYRLRSPSDGRRDAQELLLMRGPTVLKAGQEAGCDLRLLIPGQSTAL